MCVVFRLTWISRERIVVRFVRYRASLYYDINFLMYTSVGLIIVGTLRGVQSHCWRFYIAAGCFECVAS